MRLSLRNRLAAVFFAITLVAIAALYLYVAPGLQTRLLEREALGARRQREPLLGPDRPDDRHRGRLVRGRAPPGRRRRARLAATG